MIESLTAVFRIAAPLLFAATGALASDRTGRLAVFMDGAINLAAFTFIACTIGTGNPVAGFVLSTGLTMLLIYGLAIFTERFHANPFLTGLGFNLASAGLITLLSSIIFGTTSTIVLPGNGPHPVLSVVLPWLAVPGAIGMWLWMYKTRSGLELRITGSDPELLESRGIQTAALRTRSWIIAAACASAAGAFLAFSLGAWSPNISSGRGWTALAVVYLGLRHPLGLIPAALLFASADYGATILQGTHLVPGTVLLSLPYALALTVFALIKNRDK